MDTSVRFAGGQDQVCIVVPLVNDGEVEGDETFYVSLVSVVDDPDSALEHRIRLNPNRATVTINDDDG